MKPEGWAEVELGSCATFFKGSGLAKSDLTESGTESCIHYGELFTFYGPVIRQVESKCGQSVKAPRSQRGDVLMPGSDVTPRGLATASAVMVDGVVLGGDVIAIRPAAATLCGPFLAYIIRARKEQVLRLAKGSTVYHIHARDLSGLEIPLPPLAEQQAIAEALSDADAVVESLDALIAKKRDMKQAAMQQLLTGRTRLGGRKSEWSTLSVGFLATITKGSQLGRAEMNPMAEVPVWNGGVEPSGFTSIANVRRPVVTVSEGGNSCGWVGRPAGEFWLGGHCYALEPRDSHFSVGFLYHCLKSYEARIMGLRVGSGLPNIQTKSLAEFLVDVPSDPTEAANLTRVFDDMDAEIDALVAKREKAELVKQGMMQELLSGRVRLA